ncbi:MAG: alpha/beta fold hydrolase [Pegethrix bostrychoides GSE-TBD4-15B]|jgi:pimeloyl-ACP methyl ester carboxylesterase|uniref:Alpha/beta fold hydrolase n=1 Tax=Pegethrix bostrychoides GSE-TBD4-15B TaxID=2839662 RepID=A0A951PDD6_9CYAN|nr:alpha/beta fold hydrolase [Pegethrix bostrychoides GSE-TBD4-15B]
MQTAAASTGQASTGQYWTWRGHSIYYIRAGQPNFERPPLLLVHGFGASTDHWRKNIQGLSQEFEVWAIDLLGFGRSTKAAVDYGADLWRDQLQDFIASVIGRPVVLAGNSLGGYASLCLAAQRPDWAAGLVLLNPAGPFTETQLEAPAKPDPLREVLFNLSRQVMLLPLPSWLLFQYVRQKSVIRQTLEKVYLDKTAITDELIEDIYRPSCDPGAATVFAAVFKSPQGEKNDLLLSQLTCPLLMLWGEGDPWMSGRSRGARFRQHYPQLTEYYLQAGHCPHDEVPEQVNALIRDWMLNLANKPEAVNLA